MKISELVAILEQRKEQYGDTDVRIWDSRQSEYCDAIEVGEDVCTLATWGEYVREFFPINPMIGVGNENKRTY